MEFSNLDKSKKVASGPYADIYKSDGWAIKVFKEARPKVEILYEALVNSQIEATGLPVPRVRDVTRLENKQWVIAAQFANGKNLLEIMKQDKNNSDKHLDLFIDLQLKIHQKKCPKLVKMKDRLMNEINEAADIDAGCKYELMSRLEGLVKQRALVHGNFSPSNVIIDENNNPMIVDWIEASQGNPFFDAAKTFILLNFELKDMANLYLDKYIRATQANKKDIDEWLPIAAASQLKYANDKDKDILLKWIDVVQYV